jgi:hypothetical protein
VALVLGFAYVWLLIVRQRPSPPPPGAIDDWLDLAGAIAVAALVAWAWIFAGDRRALAFSPAEVSYLFPAPITRRQLIHFKLLRNQLVILFNTLLWTLILSQERFAPSAWRRAAGVWVLLTTLSLHRLGASFVRGSLAQHGASGLKRRLVSITVLAALVLGAAWVALEARGQLTVGWRSGIGEFLRALAAALERPGSRIILAPFLAMVAPLHEVTGPEWARAMGPAIAILVLHYIWVIRSDAAFEEASAEAALRRTREAAERSQARRHPGAVRRARPPYRLRPVGSPEGAIIWKNLVAVTRSGRPHAIAIAITCSGLALAALSFRPDPTLAEIAGWFAAMWAGFLLLIGPQWIRSDLRRDLPKLHLLRSYPLTGRAVVWAEVAASTLVLTLLQLGVLLVAYLAFLGNREMEPALGLRTAALGGALVLLPVVNLLGLLIHNGAALLFPAWIAPASGGGGVEALGQNMLAIVAYVVLLSLSLLAPAGIGAGLFRLLQGELGWWAVAPSGIAALAAAAVEGRAMIRWLGRVFERTDPATAGVVGY